MSTEDLGLIDFPCDFPIKIIGMNKKNFFSEIKSIVLKHFPKTKDASFIKKLSDNDKYLSITATVNAKNKKELDFLYMDLTKHPDIKMVL